MKKLHLKIITENQNYIRKAQNLAAILKEELGFKTLPEVTEYHKFKNSFVIEFRENLISHPDPTLALIDLSDKIASPWLIFYDRSEKEISLIFNKTEHCRFGRNEFNVITWANIEQTES